MMLADLPPSSSVAGMIFSAAEIAISRPISVEPVNAILSMPPCFCKNSPAPLPLPVITFTTPFGSTSLMRRISSSTLRLVSDDGFSTLVSPAAMTGASFHAAIKNGKFHGTICATTPIGSRRMSERCFSSSTFALPSSPWITPAKYLKCSAAYGTSTFSVSRIGLPLSIVSTAAKKSLFASIISAILSKILLRSLTVLRRNVLNASRAALTAASTSSLLASAIAASFLPVAGSKVSSVLPPLARTNSPFIKRPYFSCNLTIFSPSKIIL